MLPTCPPALIFKRKKGENDSLSLSYDPFLAWFYQRSWTFASFMPEFHFLAEYEEWVYPKGLRKTTYGGPPLGSGAWDVSLIATFVGPGQCPLENGNQPQIVKDSFTCCGYKHLFCPDWLLLAFSPGKQLKGWAVLNLWRITPCLMLRDWVTLSCISFT